jgi:DNA-binding NarL/FixJ family response regulator
MAAEEHLSPVRVLIAEDDPRVRAALTSLLSASPGFQVIADVGTAGAALYAARRHVPSVAIIGLQLPGAFEGLRLLRAITGNLQIPVVAMSVRDALRAEALAVGACAFLERDISPELLLAAVRSAALQKVAPD